MNVISLTQDLLTEALIEQRQAFDKQPLGTERLILPQLLKLLNNPFVVVISGLRRSGKSTLLKQLVNAKLKNNFYYVNFDDERLISFRTENFADLEKALMTQFGQKKYYLFDEVQNVDKWELFVRRLHNQGKKVIVTGSNAALLSQELGTRLTGRHIMLNVFPFSFPEYQAFHQKSWHKPLTTQAKATLTANLKRYLTEGGVPLALTYPNLPVIKQLYQDILQRDVIQRFSVTSDRELQEFALHLMSNTASLISLNKLKQVIKVGSVTTLSNYADYLAKSWLIGIVNRYSYSVKTQQIAPKKIYVADPGFVHQIGFSFSDNLGKLLETVVYWDLVRKGEVIYYYKTASGREVDFYLPRSQRLIQVCVDLSDATTKDREEAALLDAQHELGKDITSELVTLDNYWQFLSKWKKLDLIVSYNI